MKEEIRNFIFPTKIKIAIFLIFMFLAVLATIQAWGFTDQQDQKPLFYDAIRQMPFWVVMAYLLIPIMVVTVPLSQLGLGLSIFPIAIIYLYLLSCLIALIWRKCFFGKTENG